MIQQLPKITELEEVRNRTVYLVDDYGKRYRDVEEVIFNRKVKTIKTSQRFFHYLIDYLIISLIIYGIQFLSNLVGNYVKINSFNIFSITSFFSFPVLFTTATYYLFFEFLFQKTPGKFITKTVVIDEYGNKPEFKTILIRSMIRYVPFDALSCLGDNESYGWHDKWSKTWVVDENELNTIKKLQIESFTNKD